MLNPRPVRLAPYLPLLLLLLLALLGGCRSERAALQFQTGSVRASTNEQANGFVVPETLAAEVSPAQAVQCTPSAPSQQEKRSIAVRPATHHSSATTSGRKAAGQPGFRKQVKSIAKAARAPADSDYGITPVTVAIAALLGLSLLFVGIPLLVGAAFSISYWTALLFWVGFIAAAVLIGLLPMIIDDISYNLMSEEKQIEKNTRDNEKYRNNQR